MSVLIADYPVDFARLLWQRAHPTWTHPPYPRLAFWYAVIQALTAFLPGRRPSCQCVHEGVGRDQVGHDPTRQTARYSWPAAGRLFLVPGYWAPVADARSRIWMLRGFGWRIGLRLLRELWRHWRAGYAPPVAELTYRAVAYAAFFADTGAEEYVTTNVGQFPESPAMAVAVSMGLRTVCWHYAAQNVLPTKERPDQWTVPAAMRPMVSEVYVWSEATRDLWKANQQGKGPHIIVDAPRMMGKKPDYFPPSRLIGIADTPAKWRPHGIVTAAWVEAFYTDIFQFAVRYPQFHFLVKPKYLHAGVVPSAMRTALCELPNAKMMDPNANPWKLVESCGLLICLPYSSLGAAAISVGRRVFFYDPTDAARYYYDATLARLRVVGPQALRTELWMWEQGLSHFEPEGCEEEPHANLLA